MGFIAPIILIVIGIIIKYGKASFLISGYNTASKEKKATYDKDALCNYTGNFIFILAAFYTLIPIIIKFNLPKILLLPAIISFIAVTIGGIIFLNTGNRVKK